MKQILQDISNGNTAIAEAPAPNISSGHLIIATTISLVSAGTERMLVDFGKASYLQKARQQPDKVKMVLEKAAIDGFLTTYDAVRSKLAQPIPLGYCNVGKINDIGDGVEGFKIGDRVISNGSHADVVKVPKNLCARIPEGVDDESAAFTVIASIGLQGIRLLDPTLGEYIVVIGAGLIGLLTVQLLRANGCRVLAVDYIQSRLELARKFGAEICNPATGEDPLQAALVFSRGHGVDGVIITASSKSSDPVSQAARMCRRKGRIVLVGVTGLELNRSEFYEKELSFQVSCSYGPGRYDVSYEEQGHDYPYGFVRWTEKRNFEAVLDMFATGRLDVKPLITHRYAFDDAVNAYRSLSEDSSVLGLLLIYSSDIDTRMKRNVVLNPAGRYKKGMPVIGFIGAGNYASRVLIPAFKASQSQLHTIVTSGGINGVIHGSKAGFNETSTDADNILNNKTINTVAIVTRHDTHARFVVKAIDNNKHVFVEKPLCINYDELDEIEECYTRISSLNDQPPILMVGYNRRFSPQIQKIKDLLITVREPKTFIMTMNAGDIPAKHWIQDNTVGGGRIVGEACHYIDLMRFLAGTPVVSVQARRMGDFPGLAITEDKASLTLGFQDGSFGTIFYLANGSTSFPKERIEVFTGGRILQLDNFRKLKAYGWPGFKSMNLWKQDKGQYRCASAFIDAVKNGFPSPIPYEEIIEVARVSLQVVELLRNQ